MNNISPYAAMIKYGRILKDKENRDLIIDERPELIVNFVSLIEKELIFTPVDDFFSLFPPIKRYEDDGIWNYSSTLKMKTERLGTHFGKGDLIHLLMTTCYENKYLHILGVSLMEAISNIHSKRTGRSLMMDWLESQGAKIHFIPES